MPAFPTQLFSHVLARLEVAFGTAAPIVTRLVFGQAFALTGFGKLTNLDKIVAFFTELGIPFPSVQAPMVAVIELVGGILLVFGLATRVTALLLISTMLVALATADREGLLSGFVLGESFANVAPLPFLVALIWLVAKGAGRLSLDHMLFHPASAEMPSEEL